MEAGGTLRGSASRSGSPWSRGADQMGESQCPLGQQTVSPPKRKGTGLLREVTSCRGQEEPAQELRLHAPGPRCHMGTEQWQDAAGCSLVRCHWAPGAGTGRSGDGGRGPETGCRTGYRFGRAGCFSPETVAKRAWRGPGNERQGNPGGPGTGQIFGSRVCFPGGNREKCC